MKKKLRLSAYLITLAMMFSILPANAFASNAPFPFTEELNTIDEGTLDDESQTKLYACFNNLTSDEDYVVVVSRSASQPLDSANLIYIKQTSALSDGTLAVPFQYADASEINYVVACRRDAELTGHSISVTHGTSSLSNAAPGATVKITADFREGYRFTGWSVLSGGVVLSDSSLETTTFVMGDSDVHIEATYSPVSDSGSGGSSSGGSSGGSSSGGSSGGGGGGAAVVLGVGAAAAVTAGVIMTMPVEVQGRVELADHAVVPGAKISLLQNGNVVMQTTADNSGCFSLKAKRGNYELTVVYTDPNGQFIQKTTSIKAPAKDLVITF